MRKTENILILHDIRSVINVGAMFRTSDAVGIDKIYLSGYTPAPLDRFGRERGDFKKAQQDIERVSSHMYNKFPGLETRREKESDIFAGNKPGDNDLAMLEVRKIVKKVITEEFGGDNT